jgi:putative phage-type endonuclease
MTMHPATDPEERRKGIGSSDAAAALGLSPWKTTFQLWLEKTGQVEPPDLSDVEAVKWGTKLEGEVLGEYAERENVKLVIPPIAYTYPGMKFLRANPDALVQQPPGPHFYGVEAKTADASQASKWGDEGTDQIPEPYLLQVHHQMFVCGFIRVDIPVLIGGNRFRIYTVNRDERMMELMVPQLVDFWKMVETRTPPPIDYEHPTTAALLKTLYPGTDGSEIELPADMAHWHEVRLQARDKEAEYKAVAETANAHIQEAMGAAAVGWLPDGTCYTRKMVKVKGYTVEPTEYVQMRHTSRKKRGK